MSIRELEQKLVAHKYSAKTSQAYTMWAKQLRSYCGKESLEKIPVATIGAFIERQNRRGLKSESIRQAIAALKFYYRNITSRPDIIDSLPTIKRTRSLTYIPDQDEIIGIIEKIKDEEMRLLFYMVYGSGLELGEAIALTVKSINPQKLLLSFKTHRNKLRVTPLPTSIAPQILTLISQRRPLSPLFQHKGKKISVTKAQRYWASARQAVHANPRIDIRSLRHAYVIHLTKSGFLLQEVLSHLQLNASVALEYYSRYTDVRTIDATPLDQSMGKIANQSTIYPYVSQDRVAELQEVKSSTFDLSRVFAILREINDSARVGNLHAIASLLRMFIDHTAPIFGARSFKEFVNNTPLPRSLKRNFEILDGTLRNTADMFLHDHISARVFLPTELQVDFRQSLDQYLGYMISRIKS